jgi:hypothetical protein
MKYLRIVEQVKSHPWMITPVAHKAVFRLLQSKLAGELPDWGGDDDGDKFDPDALVDKNGIATVMVFGILANRIGMLKSFAAAAITRIYKLSSTNARCKARKVFSFTTIRRPVMRSALRRFRSSWQISKFRKLPLPIR